MSTSAAIVVTCDASACDRVAVVTGDHAATYETARAWARSWGWTSPFDEDWCPDHASQYGGHGYAAPFEHLQP
ncbi:hypothetical protein [Paraburkholderia sp. BR14264]|uniref:hypothetical protein n=1 Tax=Paraburkholderia sp. BR14264 TaxID=3237001 RepID=UPI00397B9CC9